MRKQPKIQIPEEVVKKAAEIGLTYQQVYSRVRDGWDYERASTTPIIWKRRFSEYAMACAKKRGISRSTIISRIDRLGWSLKKAIMTPPSGKRLFSDEICQRAEENGISYDMLRQRTKAGWDLETAITTPKIPTRHLPDDIVELAAKNGIEYRLLSHRVRRSGMTPEEAATKPKRKAKYPKKYVTMAEKNGIPSTLFYQRVRMGWDHKVAATKPPMTMEERKKNLFMQKVGRLTPVRRTVRLTKAGRPQAFWECACECGNTITVAQYQLTATKNRIQSCGCMRHKQSEYLQWEGRIFNHKEFARYIHIDQSTLSTWKKEGFSLEEIVKKAKENKQRRDELEQAKALGITANMISKRIKAGWTMEKAISTPPNYGAVIEWEGRKYDHKSFSKFLGIADGTHRGMRRKGLTTKEIVEIVEERKEYDKWSDVAHANGIPRDVFSKRMRTGKWSYEEATTVPVLEKKQTRTSVKSGI